MTYKQEPPFAVQIEASQGCNLGCDFCGIHAIGYQKKKRGFDLMTVDTARHIAMEMKRWGWNPRIEFAMHGEPTMNVNLPLLINEFRKVDRKWFIMVTSNGGGLLVETQTRIAELFDAGMNTLTLDNYQSVNIVPKIIDKLTGQSHDDLFIAGEARPVDLPELNAMLRFYPQDKTLSPHARHRGRVILVTQDISVADDGNHSVLNNHAGSAAPLDYTHNSAKCAKPFREMSIRWNGDVAICCNDWPGYYRAGNVVQLGLEKVWNGPAMQAAREALSHGRRDMIGPCNGCNALSYRVGLLPDKLGRDSLPAPSAATKRAIRQAQSQGPYTTPVRPPLGLDIKLVN